MGSRAIFRSTRSDRESSTLADLSINAFTILALGAYILIAKRAASRENSPGVSVWLRICLGVFFVCVALSMAATLSVLIGTAQGQLLGYIPGVDIYLPALHPWAVVSGYVIGNILTAIVFRGTMFWYFGYLSGAPMRRS